MTVLLTDDEIATAELAGLFRRPEGTGPIGSGGAGGGPYPREGAWKCITYTHRDV